MSREDVAAMALRELSALQAREAEVDRAVWARDLLAERCGAVIEKWWDKLNGASNRLKGLRDVGARIVPPRFEPGRARPRGFLEFASAGSGTEWDAAEWGNRLSAWIAEGWELNTIEFRHEQFETDAAARPLRSRFHFSAQLGLKGGSQRAVLRGKLGIDWSVAGTNATPAVRAIDASELGALTRRGKPPFHEWFAERIEPPAGSFFVDPLIVRDLDGDGRQEVILVSANRVYRLDKEGRFEGSALCRFSPGLVFTAVMEDFDRDGFVDLLVARFEGLVLFRGSAGGGFDQPGRLVWSAQPHLKYGQVLTCGDMDGDGDLDVWLGQYKTPYDRGQMPSPYYDANDGHPSYLLLNDGHGNFTDGTQASGLGPRSHRRVYSGSLLDLDGDGDLDLVVVSDFAGAEFYSNDGKGRFQLMPSSRVPEARGFGMAHLFADFDGDGRADFLMMGMQCPTPQRLDHAKLRRPGFDAFELMRPRMVEGNRLFRGREGGGFEASAMNESIRRSGWSWGCAAADFDCDGFPDISIATGHETRESVKDYEGEFWRHDIYVGKSEDDAVAHLYFKEKFQNTRSRGWSDGGWEKNKLFMNDGGSAFLEAGHLLGVALEADSRDMAAADLDGDGRPDLALTTFEVWPERKQTLRVFRNQMEHGHWLGVRLSSKAGRSAVGAEVSVTAGGRRTTRPVVTGDSHRTQHPPVAHFGLGQGTLVERVEVRWPGGERTVLERPGVDRWHDVERP